MIIMFMIVMMTTSVIMVIMIHSSMTYGDI